MLNGVPRAALPVYPKVASPPKVFFTMLIEPVCALVNEHVTFGLADVRLIVAVRVARSVVTSPPEHCRLVRLNPTGAVSVIVYVGDDGPDSKPLMTCCVLTLVLIENGGAPLSSGPPKPVPVNPNVPLAPTTVLLIVIEPSTLTGTDVVRLALHFDGDPGATYCPRRFGAGSVAGHADVSAPCAQVTRPGSIRKPSAPATHK
jgi:hypothetical protein